MLSQPGTTREYQDLKRLVSGLDSLPAFVTVDVKNVFRHMVTNVGQYLEDDADNQTYETTLEFQKNITEMKDVLVPKHKYWLTNPVYPPKHYPLHGYLLRFVLRTSNCCLDFRGRDGRRDCRNETPDVLWTCSTCGKLDNSVDHPYCLYCKMKRTFFWVCGMPCCDEVFNIQSMDEFCCFCGGQQGTFSANELLKIQVGIL